jgi:hypothetical protein
MSLYHLITPDQVFTAAERMEGLTVRLPQMQDAVLRAIGEAKDSIEQMLDRTLIAREVTQEHYGMMFDKRFARQWPVVSAVSGCIRLNDRMIQPLDSEMVYVAGYRRADQTAADFGLPTGTVVQELPSSIVQACITIVLYQLQSGAAGFKQGAEIRIGEGVSRSSRMQGALKIDSDPRTTALSGIYSHAYVV